MTKPIEWTTTRQVDVTERAELRVQEQIRYSDGREEDNYRPATPADLVAALRAMPAEERAEVLREFDAGGQALRCNLDMVRDQRDAETKRADLATARAEKAEREATAQRERAERCNARLLDAERERDEAREERDCSDELRMGMMPYTRATLGAEARESVRDAARRVVAERDSLRARLLAAESAAAVRPPMEYPLAEGSRWEGETIVDNDGVRQCVQNGIVTVGCNAGPLEAHVHCYAENLAALLAKGGLL